MKRKKKSFYCLLCLFFLSAVSVISIRQNINNIPAFDILLSSTETVIETTSGDDYIKWVDFDITYEALCLAYELDVTSYDSPIHLNWIELLAYAGAKCGGNLTRTVLPLFKNLQTNFRQRKPQWMN